MRLVSIYVYFFILTRNIRIISNKCLDSSFYYYYSKQTRCFFLMFLFITIIIILFVGGAGWINHERRRYYTVDLGDEGPRIARRHFNVHILNTRCRWVQKIKDQNIRPRDPRRPRHPITNDKAACVVFIRQRSDRRKIARYLCMFYIHLCLYFLSPCVVL